MVMTAASVSVEASSTSLVEVRLRHIIVHSFPGSWVAASTTSATTTHSTAITLVITTSAASSTTTSTLVVEHLLLLVVVVKALLACVSLFAALALTAGPVSHHLLLHLLLHLLQHLRVHISHGSRHLAILAALSTALAHLLLQLLHLLHLHHLHHCRIHAIHPHASIHGHLLLHHGHVLLHTLQVLGHNLWRHPSLAHLTGHGVLVTTLVFAAAPFSEFTTSNGFFLFSHVTSWLGLLDLNRFSMDFEVGAQARVDASFTFKGDESETPRPASIFIHHKSSINDTTKLGKVVLKLLLSSLLTDTTYKDLAGFLLLISWNSSLRIDLEHGDPG